MNKNIVKNKSFKIIITLSCLLALSANQVSAGLSDFLVSKISKNKTVAKVVGFTALGAAITGLAGYATYKLVELFRGKNQEILQSQRDLASVRSEKLLVEETIRTVTGARDEALKQKLAAEKFRTDALRHNTELELENNDLKTRLEQARGRVEHAERELPLLRSRVEEAAIRESLLRDQGRVVSQNIQGLRQTLDSTRNVIAEKTVDIKAFLQDRATELQERTRALAEADDFLNKTFSGFDARLGVPFELDDAKDDASPAPSAPVPATPVDSSAGPADEHLGLPTGLMPPGQASVFLIPPFLLDGSSTGLHSLLPPMDGRVLFTQVNGVIGGMQQAMNASLVHPAASCVMARAVAPGLDQSVISVSELWPAISFLRDKMNKPVPDHSRMFAVAGGSVPTSGLWMEESHFRPAREQANPALVFTGLSRIIRYCPVVCHDPLIEPIFVFLVHGTFARDSEELSTCKDRDPIFSHIKNFAQQYADSKSRPIYICSFFWSGKNDSDDRLNAGRRLSDFIRSVRGQASEIITIAHSHGGNVVNAATTYLQKTFKSQLPAGKQFFVDLMVHLGTPNGRAEVDKDFRPYAKKILNFYSLGDSIQLIGNLNGPFHNALGARMIEPVFCTDMLEGMDAYNILVKINGEINPNHSAMKILLGDLFSVVQKTCPPHYVINKDLVMSIRLKDGLPIISNLIIREASRISAEAEIQYSQTELNGLFEVLGRRVDPLKQRNAFFRFMYGVYSQLRQG